MPRLTINTPHAWRELFASDSTHADIDRMWNAGLITDDQRTQATYEMDHAGVVISRGLAERAEIECREIEAWELHR